MSKVAANNEFDEMIGAPDFQDNLGEIINPKLGKIDERRSHRWPLPEMKRKARAGLPGRKNES